MTNSNALRSFTSLYNENPNKGSDTPREEEVVGDQYEGSVDWDAEWKKVVDDRDQPSQRPGNYKTPAEIAAIKATNKVAKNVFDASQDMKSNLPSAPSIRSLQGDWRFWIGILVILSFGLSILSATSSAPVNDSFYIWDNWDGVQVGEICEEVDVGLLLLSYVLCWCWSLGDRVNGTQTNEVLCLSARSTNNTLTYDILDASFFNKIELFLHWQENLKQNFSASDPWSEANYVSSCLAKVVQHACPLSLWVSIPNENYGSVNFSK